MLTKDREGEDKKREEASLICGTCGERLWLLRSRPDQVNHATMRRGPPDRIITEATRLVARFLFWPETGGVRRPPLHQMPSSCHSVSMRVLISGDIVIGVPHSRLVSPGHLLVASIPILLPSPLIGEAKSR